MIVSRIARVGFAVLAVVGVGWWASPGAWAHGGGALPDAVYYRSTVTSIDPAVSGLEVSLSRAGESVTLTNHSSSTIVVIGYAWEPYLRITPTAVDENVDSLSYSLNGSPIIEGLPAPPAPDSPTAPPRWNHVRDVPSYTWHDHRVHWMAPQRPAVVAADPQHPHPVFDWTIPLDVDGHRVIVNGTLEWTGAPGFSYLIGAIVVTAVVSGLLMTGMIIFVVRRDRAQLAATLKTANADQFDTTRT